MSTSSNISLGALRQASKEAADLENNGAVPDDTWNQFITESSKELYDMLLSAYGNDYYVANTYQFQTTSAQSYPLPDGTSSFTDTTGSVASKFYKLLGVDLQYSASPSGWVTLRRVEFIDRNKYAYPNTQSNYLAQTNLRYRVQGNNLYVVPVPQPGQTVQVWYAPAQTSLQFRLQSTTTSGSQAVTTLDTTGLAVNMSVSGTGIPTGTTISTVTGTTTFTISANAQSTLNSNLLSIWSDSTTIDGINGWEQYAVIDAAIKAKIKIEEDASSLMAQKMELKQRIEAMAEGRDIGQAMHTSDVLGAAAWNGDGYGSGYGDGGFF